MSKKVILSILSAVVVFALGFCVVWTVSNFDTVKEGIKGSSLYTQSDIESAYKDGYDSAVKDMDSLLAEVENLKIVLSEKEEQIKNLEIKLSDYNATKSEVESLKVEKANLEKEVSNLKKSIQTYEAFVEEIKLADRLVVTYMYDGYVCGLQRYDAGQKLSLITAPQDTEEVKFVGWTINGTDVIDLTNFTVNESVTFVAKVSKTFTVKFIVDGEVFNSQKVAEYGSCTLPQGIPDKFGYVFDGWSKDGVNCIEAIEDEVVTSNTTYTAVFSLFEVQVSINVSTPNNPLYIKGIKYSYDILTEIPWSVEKKEGSGMYDGYCLYHADSGLPLYFQSLSTEVNYHIPLSYAVASPLAMFDKKVHLPRVAGEETATTYTFYLVPVV